jgi:excisionase family DNA binding protein
MPLWTVVEAADYLGVSERYLRDSAVPKVRMGRLVRYIPAEVMEFARRKLTHSLLNP